jgi:SagB-type dehydrogenase family enzyme
MQKPYSPNQKMVDLVKPEDFKSDFNLELLEAISRRRSVRQYSDELLSLKELSFLLWATQGTRLNLPPLVNLRTVPSAGARHGFETYLYIRLVRDLDEGIYRYLPLEHKLAYEFSEQSLAVKMGQSCFGQAFVGFCAVTFIWSVIPERMEWRYHLAAHKVLAIDVGHVCQNLYLACEAINAGTCAIGAYDQERMDKLLRLDGEEEFVIYLAPVGK